MATLKVAVVGTGKVAQNNYLPCLAAEPDVALAYYSRTRSKAEACASKFGGVSMGSLRELMDWQPDTVFILTREMEAVRCRQRPAGAWATAHFLREATGSTSRAGERDRTGLCRWAHDSECRQCHQLRNGDGLQLPLFRALTPCATDCG